MHTFLFEEGLWKVEGFYYKADGEKTAVNGETRIIHQPDLWINEGKMVFSSEGLEISNRYEFVPFQKTGLSSTWTSQNPSLGNLVGTFTVVDESILSHFQSAGGELKGLEVLRQISPDQYEARGVVFKESEFLSSWAVKMERVQGGWLH